jgi:S-DNA-T family DNA segregation ATPase FtsK/SpoIIIE
MTCAECGFSHHALAVDDAPGVLRDLGRRYRVPLTRGLKGEDLDALLRAHPLDGTWSALEYACHFRDVLSIQRERLERARSEDGYAPEPMRRDERVVELRYNDQDPVEVADTLAANAEAVAAYVETFDTDDWERTMTYSFPEVAERPLTWVVRHTVHEGEHHLLDIGRVLRAARGR